MSMTMIHSVSLVEREQKKINEDRKCVICLEERKLRIREWLKKDGVLAR